MRYSIKFTDLDDAIVTFNNEEEDDWYGHERGASFDDISIEIDLKNFCNLTPDEFQRLQSWAVENAEVRMRAAIQKRNEKQAERDRLMEERNRRLEAERKANKNKRPGYVYLILAENGLYKIGKAKNITERMKPFSVEFPMRWELVHSFHSDNYTAAEMNLHEKFQDRRAVGEWFGLAPEDVAYITALQDGQL